MCPLPSRASPPSRRSRTAREFRRRRAWGCRVNEHVNPLRDAQPWPFHKARPTRATEILQLPIAERRKRAARSRREITFYRALNALPTNQLRTIE